MNSHAKVLGGIAVLLAILLLVFGSGWRSDTSGGSEAGSSPREIRARSAVSPHEEGVATIGVRSALADGGPAIVPGIDRDHDLHGRVIDPSGNPIEGAKVAVFRDDASGYPTDGGMVRARRGVAETRTDPRGEFAITLPIGRPFDLQATANGFAPADLGYRYAGEQVTIQLGAGATLIGRVTRSEDGRPVADAVLDVSTWLGTLSGESLLLQRGRTDPEGRFRFVDLPAIPVTFRITPSLEACAAERDVDLVAGGEHEENVVVESGQALRGRVLDAETREPIAGAVVLDATRPERSVVADADGAYAFRGIGKGPVALQARAHGYGSQNKVFRSRSGVDDLPDRHDFVLSLGRRVRGRVVDGGGEGLSGAYVAAVAQRRTTSSPSESDRVADRSDERGAFELADLRGDLPHVLVARKDGLGAVVYELPSTEADEGIVELGDVVLPPMSVVRGSVVDDAGEPVPDWKVVLRGSNADRGRFRPERGDRDAERGDRDAGVEKLVARRVARTDDLGRFAFADLAPGEYSAEVGYPTSTATTSKAISVRAGQLVEDVRLVLRSLGSIEGIVTDARGRGLSEAGVVANGEGSRASQRSDTRTDAAGRFALEGLPPGTYQIHVFADRVRTAGESDERHRFLTRSMRDVSTGERDLRIVLEPAALLRGRVVDADGQGIVGARVSVVVPGREIRLQVATGAEGRFAVSIPEGVFVDLEARRTAAETDPDRARRLNGVSASDADVIVELPR